MANCLSWASSSPNPRFQSIWYPGQTGHCRPGRPLFAIIWKGSRAIDLFVVPTITFQQLFAFLVLRYERRQLLWFAVTRNPTAEWLARQITEAFPWDRARNISFVTMIGHLVSRSRLGCKRWASGTGPHRSARPGRMDMLNA